MNLQSQLTHLENAGLIRLADVGPDLAYHFRHGLIRDAAYATLLRIQRQQWHLATAEVLESASRLEPDAVGLAPVLAHHFTEAGDRRRALHYLVIAGDLAFNNYANAEAAGFYRRALDITGHAGSAEYDASLTQHLYSRHGRALELTSRFDAALDNYRSMEATAQQHGDKALELAAVMARATIHSTGNMAQDLPQAAGLLERASALAQELGDRAAEANINWTLLLNNSMAGGDSAQSIGYGQHALDLARSLNQRELMAFILTDLWFAYASAGRWEQARARLEEGCAIARELGNLAVVTESLGRISMTDLVVGRYDQALAGAAQAMEAAEAMNSTDSRALTRAHVGVIHMDRGDLDQAIALSEAAIRFGEITGNVTVLIGTRSDLARAYALLGDVERGLALAQQAENDGRRFQIIAGWAGAAVVHLRLCAGDLAGAAAALSQLPDYRDLMRRIGFVPFMWGKLGLAGIELALAQQDAAGALEQACELIEHLERTSLRSLLPPARLLQGQTQITLGRLDEAGVVLQTARTEAEALGARRWLWPILAALSKIASERNPAQARGLRQQARQMVDYIAAHAPTPALRQSFLARADVQPLLEAGA